MPMPIEQYYRVHSTSGRPLLEIVGRVLSTLSASERRKVHGMDQRPVVFVSGPFSTADEMYVSAGALTLMLAARLTIRQEAAGMSLRELPGDLMMLRGDACDSDAYEHHKDSLMESAPRD
jgi:hypothetical protein